MRSKVPALLGHFVLAVDHLQGAFVALRHGDRTLLRFLHDCSRVLCERSSGHSQIQETNHQEIASSENCTPVLLISSASTSEPRTAASAGPIAATNAATRITGTRAKPSVSERVVQIDPTQVAAYHPQRVIDVQHAQCDSENQADRANAQSFEPDRAANLPAQSADGLKNAKFPASIGNGNCQRIDDSQHRDQNGNKDLNARHRKPLVYKLEDVLPNFAHSK